MKTVMITGANRGLGLELARQYAADGWRVLATCRHPEKADALQALDVTVAALDVGDAAAVRTLAETWRDETIDILINNAGIYGAKSSLGGLDYENLAEVLAINTLAPIRVAETFLDQVARGEDKIIAMVTSKMGSIADNGSGGSYVYRSSKAALNAATKSLALDSRDRGIRCVLLHPGWVRTDMGGPNGLIDAPESCSGMRRVLADLADDAICGFYDYAGKEIPW